jgi:hypothetical protein
MFENAKDHHTPVLDESIWKKLQRHEKKQIWKTTANSVHATKPLLQIQDTTCLYSVNNKPSLENEKYRVHMLWAIKITS